MEKTTQVGDNFRTNELSLVPGGSTVKIFYGGKKVVAYDKIKDPVKYCNVILSKNMATILKIEVDGVLYYQNTKK